MNKWKIQLCSDLHLETRPQAVDEAIPPPSTAATLVLAGDICPFAHPKYRDFLLKATQNHARVAYVAGNHEFYGSPGDVRQTLEAIDSVCRSLPSHVRLLCTGTQPLEVPGTGVSLIGATLWTDVSPGDRYDYKELLNDFSHIRVDGKRLLRTEDVAALHHADRGWILSEVKRAGRRGERVVVVSHHAPDRCLSVLNRNGKADEGMGPLYYASDMHPVYCNDSVAAWLYGHTHEVGSKRLPDREACLFATNALGYPGEDTGFAPRWGVDLKDALK
jgi:predicted phosphodiesterase